MLRRYLSVAVCLPSLLSAAVRAQSQDAAATRLGHEVLKQLIEINTTESAGSTTIAAEAMRARLLAAGFPADDTVVVGPEKRGNLVVRYRAKPGSSLKPVLMIGHLDVVEAKRDDWTTDPFTLVEKDGYFYGRGTQDMKDADAAMVVAFLRMKQEGYVPDRDLILALTAAEEGGEHNGVDWLLKNRRPLVEAQFALNPDSGGVVLDKGRPETMTVEATEKLYADYRVTATNPGGHSSLPRPDNAIYALANALVRLEKEPFPVELNEVTRAYFKEMATIEHGQTADDMRALLGAAPDAAAAARLSKNPAMNTILRTTCVATMLSGGHAPNALPGRATANVNCRIFPGHSQEEIRQELIRRFADPSLTVEYIDDSGHAFKLGSSKQSMAPPPLSPEVMQPLRAVTEAMWPKLPIVPVMEAGASDSIYTMAAGIPSYGFSGMGVDRDDVRAHGRDERLRVKDFDAGVLFEYRYLKALTTP